LPTVGLDFHANGDQLDVESKRAHLERILSFEDPFRMQRLNNCTKKCDEEFLYN